MLLRNEALQDHGGAGSGGPGGSPGRARSGAGDEDRAGHPPRPVLPLDPQRLRRVAVIGRLADAPNTGDHGSSKVTSPYVVTPLAGLRGALQPLGVEVVHDDGSVPERAAAVAATADATIVIAGYDYRDEGEYMGKFPAPGLREAASPPAPAPHP